MTIKTRNRLNISLFVFSIVYLAVTVLFLLLLLYNKTLLSSLNTVVEQSDKGKFLTKYNPLIVLISLYFQIIYVCATSFTLFRVFEKTQAYDIPYLFLFLIALIANSFRIWVPLFNMSGTYSGLMLFCGNSILFSKLLVPTSLLFSVVMSGVEQRQDLEKNIFILILGCLFFAQLLPLNTANICRNFEIDYSYRNVIKITSILIVFATLIALFFNNVGDKTAPQISFEGKEFTYKEGDDDAILLSDVTVKDNQDNQVDIIVSSKIILSDGSHMLIKYVAMDKNKNVAERKRIVNYQPLNTETTDTNGTVETTNEGEQSTEKETDENVEEQLRESYEAQTDFEVETTIQ